MPDTTGTGDVVVTGKPAGRDPNTLTIIAGGVEITGWIDVQLSLRAEAFPNSFNIATSSRQADGKSDVNVKDGDPCTVLLGDDVVITGYVDRVVESWDKDVHTLALSGRGKTQDLTDCSAEWPSGQMIEGTVLTIATRLAQPYGIAVEMGNGAEPGQNVPAVLLNYGETAAEIIQRCARNAALLAYENGEGKLILAKVGTDRAASGIAYGTNVQQLSVSRAMDDRYSTIRCAYASQFVMGDVKGIGASDSFFFDTETDPNVPRHRLLYIAMEQVASDPEKFTASKAKWELARRAGRSRVVMATVDSWRDSKGKLWKPNTIAPVDFPRNTIGKDLVIAEATFLRSNEQGTTARLVLMPPAAFSPEPITLQTIATTGVTGAPSGGQQQ